VEHPVGNASVRISDVERREVKYGSSEMVFNLDGDQLFGRGTVGGRSLTVEHMHVDFGRDSFNVEAFVNDLDITDFIELEKRDSIFTKLTGELALSGNTSGDVNLTGMARFFDAAAGYENFIFRNKKIVEIKMEEGSLFFDVARFYGKNIVFDIAGMANEKDIKLTVKGIGDLGAVKGFTDAVQDSSGRLEFNVMLDGPVDSLVIRGGAKVKDGEFLVDGFPNRIRNVSGSVEMGGGKLRLNDFTGNSAGGTIDLDGWASINKSTIDDYRFNMRLANLEIQLLEELSIKASTVKNGLVLSPSKKRNLPHISGDVEISRLGILSPFT
jgi:hypothetical protein